MTRRTDVTQRTLTTHCKLCDHQWDSPFLCPMPMERAGLQMKAITVIGCPHCGVNGDNVLVGPTPVKTGRHDAPSALDVRLRRFIVAFKRWSRDGAIALNEDTLNAINDLIEEWERRNVAGQ